MNYDRKLMDIGYQAHPHEDKYSLVISGRVEITGRDLTKCAPGQMKDLCFLKLRCLRDTLLNYLDKMETKITNTNFEEQI